MVALTETPRALRIDPETLGPGRMPGNRQAVRNEPRLLGGHGKAHPRDL